MAPKAAAATKSKAQPRCHVPTCPPAGQAAAVIPKIEMKVEPSDDERNPSQSPKEEELSAPEVKEEEAEERERSPTPHLVIERRPEVADDEASVFPDASHDGVAVPATEAPEDEITGVAGVCPDSVLHLCIQFLESIGPQFRLTICPTH